MIINLSILNKPENPTGSEMNLSLELGYLIMNFHPPTINKLLK